MQTNKSSSLKGSTVLCPVCSAFRDKPQWKAPRAQMVGVSLGVGAFAFFTGWMLWNPYSAGWIGILCGVLCFLSAEVYYSVQFRRELECPVCHFDPLLYKRSPEKAKAQCLEGIKKREQLLSGARKKSGRQKLRELHG